MLRPTRPDDLQAEGCSNSSSPSSNGVNHKVPMSAADKEKHREHVAREIAQSEKSYVDNLELVVSAVLNPLKEQSAKKPAHSLPGMRKERFATMEELAKIFVNLSQLLELHKLFRAKLDLRIQNWSPDAQIADIFLADDTDFFPEYARFANHFAESSATLARCKQRKAFCRFLTRLEFAIGIMLPSFLIMPIQRLPRYELLFKELQKFTPTDHKDYETIPRALQKILKYAKKTNIAVFCSLSKVSEELAREEADPRRPVRNGVTLLEDKQTDTNDDGMPPRDEPRQPVPSPAAAQTRGRRAVTVDFSTESPPTPAEETPKEELQAGKSIQKQRSLRWKDAAAIEKRTKRRSTSFALPFDGSAKKPDLEQIFTEENPVFGKMEQVEAVFKTGSVRKKKEKKNWRLTWAYQGDSLAKTFLEMQEEMEKGLRGEVLDVGEKVKEEKKEQAKEDKPRDKDQKEVRNAEETEKTKKKEKEKDKERDKEKEKDKEKQKHRRSSDPAKAKEKRRGSAIFKPKKEERHPASLQSTGKANSAELPEPEKIHKTASKTKREGSEWKSSLARDKIETVG